MATARGTAVVTGASSGIGAATAARLARTGWDVVIGARRTDRLKEVAAATGARALPLDVTDQASVDAFADQVGACRLLVNNAGGAIGLEPVAEADLADWQAMYDTNVLGVARVTKALLPELVRAAPATSSRSARSRGWSRIPAGPATTRPSTPCGR